MNSSLTRSNRPRVLLAASAAAAFGMVSTAAANIYHYTANMDGPSESPPNGSLGVGFAQVDIDTLLNTMRVQQTFSGLTGTTTASHIHSATAVPFTGTAGVATQIPSFSGFPLGVTSGTMDTTFDMTLASSYNPSFMAAHGGTPAGAAAFLFQSIHDGTAYVNIHTSFAGGGEIRGFLVQVPAPGAAMLLGIGGLAAARRRRN